MPAVASTTPPVLIAAAAARTSRIRVGSGGVMLPNHSPLVVAEQFAALEALAPGRIDLGIGRAPGSDPVITQLLRHVGHDERRRAVPRPHPRHPLARLARRRDRAVHERRDVRRARDAGRRPARPRCGCSARATTRRSSRRRSACRTCSRTTSRARGSSARSTCTARSSGRARRTPSRVTFLTVNAVAAPTADEAEARVAPAAAHDGAAAHRTSRSPPLETVEQALRRRRSNSTRSARVDHGRRRARTGSSARARRSRPSSPRSPRATASTR